ncbi:hypothetical protein SKAU_G00228610 [Synaphobranchus kaupii]|uniref:Uncharacterized protein n=1 Tax=Synaphobranchus kaupii TaxID=118154 RepID=A0A9Q1IS52_SYNKA|nr:hypothetical protein SKAU_G00228610 [Synaphobranchus kaupii]
MKAQVIQASHAPSVRPSLPPSLPLSRLLGNPLLPYLEWLPAQPALHLHPGAPQSEHVPNHLPALRVASGGGGAELQPRLQHRQGQQAAGCRLPDVGQQRSCSGGPQRIPDSVSDPTEDL